MFDYGSLVKLECFRRFIGAKSFDVLVCAFVQLAELCRDFMRIPVRNLLHWVVCGIYATAMVAGELTACHNATILDEYDFPVFATGMFACDGDA